MDRSDIVLATLATSNGVTWEPVQVQKIFFLLDRRVGKDLGGPHWSFAPYDYGPFDSSVYDEIRALADRDLAAISRPPHGMRTFSLTPGGQREGERLLASMPDATRAYIEALSKWVRGLTFQQLVSAIYREYPEMKERSVFRG